ncbi:uncharacterized protein Z519_11558 [Cladophialophora bantiana CBS 173.52]|uniref:DNA polymerase delta subunit 4 n=1 Tax=Cladophialophora bantiana (strain ATCC 10958 / CBS 173.52 / CDC B-1940 / NIH 8579) TaxID=1442370 RepID=A0A0D2H3U7_CLAB1|nr:uncharacterized protein Z519_11558 [Cladophialophora bantiana CBS 173.52]KIW87973.1 hypothetical protein Z519_11558 [Cladophialophora bantiana CBS 173.52]
MPRGRKSATSHGHNPLQSTLSFNNKSARVTKPSAKAHRDEHAASVKKLTELEDDGLKTEPEDVTDGKNELASEETEESPQDLEPDAEPEEEVAVKARSRKKQKAKSEGKDERELAAEKVTDVQLKKYWQAEEDSRLAPRVHQSDLSLHEKILRHFDLSSQYGPCIGIPRLQRWRRANALGLEPPVEVLAVLLREQDRTKSQGCGKMAYIDELGGGRVILVE